MHLVLLLLISFFGCKKSMENKSIFDSKIESPSSFIATSKDYQSDPVSPNSIILGYVIDGYMPSDKQYKNLTHIAISFLKAANTNGDVEMTSGWENIDEVVASAHRNNVKVLISFGGGGIRVTSRLMGVKINRKNLINNIIKFMKTHNLDGFDCDWEPSWLDDKAEMESINNAITHHYIKFIKELREAIDQEFGKGSKSFSAAVLNRNSIWYSDKKQIAHFPKNGWWHYLDWVSLMNYDNDLGSKHSTYESVFGESGSVAHWMEFGIPKSKIVIGIPFYARAGWGEEWLSYKDIRNLKAEISDTTDFILYNKNKSGLKEYGFNNKATVAKKVNTGKKMNLPGIMFWQLAGDLPVDSENSLLRVISTELGYKKDGSR